MGTSPTFRARIDSRTSVYPENKVEGSGIIEVPLSIADCNCAFLPAPSIVWIFDLKAPGTRREFFEPGTLERSLRKALDAYRFWTGRVSQTTSGSDTIKGEGRLSVIFNSGQDNGVDFVIATSSISISQIIFKDERHTRFTSPPQGLVPSGLKRPSDLLRDPGAHPVNVQVTYFRDEAVAIGIKAPHFLADAQALSHFAQHWASINSSTPIVEKPSEKRDVVFSPLLLDEKVLGTSTSDESELLKQSREVQPTQYDSYQPRNDRPSELQDTKRPLLAVTGTEIAHKTFTASALPWEEHHPYPSTLRHIVHFTRRELELMANATSHSSQPGKVGSITLLMAHVWKCIVQARAWKSQPNEVHHLAIAAGVRGRLSLPASFVGSPVIIANTSIQASAVSQVTPFTIKSILSRVEHGGVRAVLYRKMQGDVLRMWDCVLGRKHTCISSWIGTGLYRVDFTGTGVCPLFAGSAENLPDGMIVFNEPRPSAAVDGKMGYNKSDGIDVTIFSDDEEALYRLHANPELKPKQLPSSRL